MEYIFLFFFLDMTIVPVSINNRLEVSVSANTRAFCDQSELDHFTKVLLPTELELLVNTFCNGQEENKKNQDGESTRIDIDND
jgi:hypothetical protein